MIYAVHGILFRQTPCFVKWFYTLLCSLSLLWLSGTSAQAAPTQDDTVQGRRSAIKAPVSYPLKYAAPTQQLRTIRLQPKVRVQSWDQRGFGLSSASIRPWLERYWIVPTASLDQAAYVLGSADQRVIAAVGQTIYVRGKNWSVGQDYRVYRHSEPYHLYSTSNSTQPHPRLAEKTVQELIEVARGKVVDTQADTASMQLTQTFAAEVRRGDLVVAGPEVDFPTQFVPISSQAVLAGGQIVRIMGSIAFAGKDSIVTIDRGQQHGARVGQVLRVLQHGDSVADPKSQAVIKLPQQQVAHVMVVKSFAQLSYAYVLDSRVPIYVGAQLQSLSTSDLNQF